MEKRIIIFTLLLLCISQTSALNLCENATINEANLEIKEIQDINELGDEPKWIWSPNEKVEVEVEVENKNYSERNFKVELVLINKNNEIEQNFTTNNNDLIKEISLDAGSNIKINFSFQIDNIDDGTYYFYAKFSDKNNESICTSLKAKTKEIEIEIEIEEEEREIIIKKIYGPSTIALESKVEYVAEIINIGNVKENRILVIAYNSNFNLRAEKEILGLEVGEVKNATFEFTIPSHLSSTQETILFGTEYDYNENTKYYEKISSNSARFTVRITEVMTNEEADKKTLVINEEADEKTPTIKEQNETQIKTENKLNHQLLWAIVVIVIVSIFAGIFFYLKMSRPQYTELHNASKINTYLTKIGVQNKPVQLEKPKQTFRNPKDSNHNP